MSGRRPGLDRAQTQSAKDGRVAARGRRRPASTAGEPIVPEVYQEMLRESGVAASATRKKRRRVENQDDAVIDTAWPTALAAGAGSNSSKLVQTGKTEKEDAVAETEQVEGKAELDNFDEGDSDEDDEIDWEDVDLTTVLDIQPTDLATLEITLNDSNGQKKSLLERRRITAIDRKIRLEAHKLHLLCLFAHVSLRNTWCNDEQVQQYLRRQNILDDTLLANLNPASQLYQMERNTRFLKGLTEAKNRWRKRFWTIYGGLARPHWVDSDQLRRSSLRIETQPLTGINLSSLEDGEPPMTKADFINASEGLKGSRDLGAQLFCALLRAAGVTARLVSSLQPLPFTFVQKGSTPALSRFASREGGTPALSRFASRGGVTPVLSRFASREGGTPALSRFASREEEIVSPLPSPGIRSPVKGSISSPVQLQYQYDPRIPAAQREILASLRPGFHLPELNSPKAPQSPVRGSIVVKNESQYPVYWVEAWNVATQKWIPVDPLVTNSVGSVGKFEPPQVDPDNSMSYVVAFEEEGHVKDVTRRYAKTFNAKTRKLRLNSCKGGELWWLKVLELHERSWNLDRDQVEDSELASKELSEGIPASIADLKDHPLFALKRHLRRNQVIHPERPVGSITTGTGPKAVTEIVYRRQDVKMVRSSMQWYRLGREIKTGEQPLKHVIARKRKRREGLGQDSDEDGDGETSLYAIFQTEVYIPPAIVDGMVPKNSFGNIDVYVPSMVPQGGIHVPHKDAIKAARIIGIDYAEAVTAFEHKGRQASAVIKGIVVAEEYKEALYAILDALISEKEQEDAEKKAIESLKLWKKFLLGLRIRERIENEYGDVKDGEGLSGWERESEKLAEASKGKGKLVQSESVVPEEERSENEEAGGFVKYGGSGAQEEPVSLRFLATKQYEGEDEGNAFFGEGGFPLDEGDDTYGGGFVPETTDGVGNHRSDGGARGDGDGGGFVAEEEGIAIEGQEDEGSVMSQDPDMDNEDLDWF